MGRGEGKAEESDENERKGSKKSLFETFNIEVVKFHDARIVSHIFVESTFDASE